MLYLSKNSYLRIFVNPGPGSVAYFSFQYPTKSISFQDTEKVVVCLAHPNRTGQLTGSEVCDNKIWLFYSRNIKIYKNMR